MAEDFLKKKGYDVVDRNFRTKWGEIDLVCRKKDVIIFVEVKTRIGEKFGLPEDAFNKDKMFRLRRNADAYMAFNAKQFSSYKIEGVCIVMDERELDRARRIDHYEDLN